MKKEWEDYRRDTVKAFEQLIDLMSKDEEGISLTKISLLTFPDSTLSAMQVQAIKKRSVLLHRYQTKISDLEEEKAILQAELKKIRKSATEKELESQKLLKTEQ